MASFVPPSTSGRRRARRALLQAGRGALLLVAPLIWGCGLGPVDRSIHELIEMRSEKMGAVPVRPREYADPRAYDREGQYRTELETTNPPASALNYTPADPNRDPSVLLNEFALQASGRAEGEELRLLSLSDVWDISQSTAREYLSAEEDYIFAAIRLLIERHLWGPRFFDDVRAAVAGNLDEGSNQASLNVVNDLRVTQRLPYGGQVEAAWIWQATEQLREQATGQYEQSSRLVLSGNVPLLRGAGQSARESRIQAERDLVYAARSFERFRREFFVDIGRDYFDLLAQQAGISNQKRVLRSVYEQLEETKAKFKAGDFTQIDVNNVQNTVLRTKSDLDDQRDRYITSLDRFKIRLGIPVEQYVDVVPIAFDLTEPAVSLEEATSRALSLRLDLQNERDQLDDGSRAVANARNELLPDLDVNGALTLPTDNDDSTGGLVLDADETAYEVGVTFGLPLDRQIERLQLRQSVIELERQMRNLEAFEDNVILSARSTRRFMERARATLALSEERVRITEQRKEEQTLKRDETTTQERLDTENDLIQALNARDESETALRIAILDYLLATGQLRVKRDGELEPIPGMEFPPARMYEEIDDLDKWYLDPELPEAEEIDDAPADGDAGVPAEGGDVGGDDAVDDVVVPDDAEPQGDAAPRDDVVPEEGDDGDVDGAALSDS